MWDAPRDSRLSDQHCGHQTLHTLPPTPPPRPRQPPGMPDLHSLGCCRVGPGGRGAHHGGDGEALLQPGKDPPAPRGQCCGGRANIASDKRRGRPHPRPAREGPPAPLLPLRAAPERGVEAERRQRAQCPWVPQGGPVTSPQAAGAGCRHLAEPPCAPPERFPAEPAPRGQGEAFRRPAGPGASAVSSLPPSPRPRRPGPPFRGCAGPRSRRVPAARGEVIHCRRLVKSV